MKNRRDVYPDPEDMFNDTRMSFGDHLEELRWHLIRAIYGFVLCMIVSLAFGKPILNYIAKPVEDQLGAYWSRYNAVKIVEMTNAIENGDDSLRPRPVLLDLKDLVEKLNLKKVFEANNIPLPAEDDFNPVPAFEHVFRMLGVEGAIDQTKLPNQKRYIEIKQSPREFIKQAMDLNLAMRPPRLSTLNVQEAFMVYFKVCLMAGFVLASPWVFYQVWSFIAAGLYPNEKRLVNVYLPYSLGLFLGGVVICELFVIPKAIEALLWFNEWLGLQPDLRLNEWLGFAIMMPLVFGLSFQTPLVMLFTERIGLFDADTFRRKRKIAMFVIVVFAAVITPSTDAFSMLLLAGPMVLLYELGIILCVWKPHETFDEMDTPDSQELIEV